MAKTFLNGKHMPLPEQAWIVKEWVFGEALTDIGWPRLSQSNVRDAIAGFCSKQSGIPVGDLPLFDERKDLARKLLAAYIGRGGDLKDPSFEFDKMEHYSEARDEHAFLLRCEGMTYAAIAQRLGVSVCRVSHLVMRFGRRMKYSMKHTKFYISRENDGDFSSA